MPCPTCPSLSHTPGTTWDKHPVPPVPACPKQCGTAPDLRKRPLSHLSHPDPVPTPKTPHITKRITAGHSVTNTHFHSHNPACPKPLGTGSDLRKHHLVPTVENQETVTAQQDSPVPNPPPTGCARTRIHAHPRARGAARPISTHPGTRTP